MKTTKTDFAEYRKWCAYYLDKFGLSDWTVYYRHEDIGSGVAHCARGILNRGVTFALNTEIADYNPTDFSFRRIARHEVCHLLIAEVSDLVGGFVSEDEAKRADEALVCRLTNLLDDE